MNPRRLVRSRDRQLAGVAGGMAEYLDIDPTVIRVLWIIVVIASGGLALLAYLVLALVMPRASYATAPAAPSAAGATPGAAVWGAPSAPPAPIGGWDAASSSGSPAGTGAAAYAGTYPRGYAGAHPGGYAAPAAYAAPRVERHGIGLGAIVGVVLVVVGVIALADAALPGWVSGAILGPAVILTLGAALLASSLRWRRDEVPQAATAASSAAPYASAPASATVASEAPAPGPDPAMTPATPWDVTDTQAVGPAVTLDADEGTRPA